MAEPAFYFNPFDPAFRANPYPYYSALREGAPKSLNVFMPTVLVARYDDATEILHDAERFSSRRPLHPAMREVNPFGADTMLTSDPPIHTRLRRLVSRDFTPRRIAAMEPRIRELTERLLDQVARQREFDVMGDLANQLPVLVIAEMLGVPAERHHEFKRWSDAIIATAANSPGVAPAAESMQAAQTLKAFLAEQIEIKRREPGQDLVSALVAAHDDDEALSADELLAFLVLLLLAGNETTTNLIGNAMLALGRHPDQMDRLRAKPEMIKTAVEEAVRYDGPVQATARVALEDVEIGGTLIPAKALAMVVLAAANRDPAQFAAPEQFDVGRTPNNHLAFGNGIHFCLGAPLARLEGAIAISHTLARFPRLRLSAPDGPLTYKGSFVLRGLASLPMTIA